MNAIAPKVCPQCGSLRKSERVLQSFLCSICYDETITRLRFEEIIDKLKAKASIAEEMAEYISHDLKCILSQWQQGGPTPDGGYRAMYAGKWYQSKPVDETPKCNCGLGDLWAKWKELGVDSKQNNMISPTSHEEKTT